MRVIYDYRIQRRRQPTRTVPVCTACETWREVLRVLGAPDSVEARRHMRRLRDSGVLITKSGPHSLQAKLKGGQFVWLFGCAEADIPRLGRPRSKPRIGTW